MSKNAYTEIPADRCGFEFSPREFGDSRSVTKTNRMWYVFRPFTCWRETWKESDRCILHAEVDRKPIYKIKEAIDEHTQRLDGAYLNRLDIQDKIDFSGYSLQYTQFEGANLEPANLSNVDAAHANFRNAELSFASLQEGSFTVADFSGANAQIVNARGASFSGADLSGSIFSNSDFTDVDLMDADLSEASFAEVVAQRARLSGADFTSAFAPGCRFSFTSSYGTKFDDAILYDSRFIYSDFDRSSFAEAKCSGSNFKFASLEDADFSNCALYGADFRGSRLYGTTFTGAKVDDETIFQNHYEFTPDNSITNSVYPKVNDMWGHKLPNVSNDDNSEENNSRKGIWSHKQAEELYRQNSLPQQSRHHHSSQKDIHRTSFERPSLHGEWWRLTFSKHVTGYGENPYSVGLTAGLTIGIFSILYAILGGVESDEVSRVPSIFGIESISTIADSIYFSILTFSTLGYGDLQPASWPIRFLATIEALLGAVLIALFVYTIGRRSSRY